MNDPTHSKYRYLNFKQAGAYRRFSSEDDNIKNVPLTPTQQETPVHGTYGALLFDPRWKTRREEILYRDAYSCVICRGKSQLQVHHRQYHFNVRQNQYQLPWDYPDHLLITLCESCHKRGHNQYKVPTINT